MTTTLPPEALAAEASATSQPIAAEVLDGAADHIEKYGHIKGSVYGEGSVYTAPACLFGAISAARHKLRVPCICAPSGPLGLKVGAAAGLDQDADVVEWNDAPETTVQQILDALRLAAKTERCAADDVECVAVLEAVRGA